MKNNTNLIIGIIIVVLLINISLVINNYFVISKIKTGNTTNDLDNSFIRQSVLPLNLSGVNPFSTVGFSKVNQINIAKDGVILNFNCSSVKLVSHEYQMYSIERGLKGRIDVRPTIHDNLKDLFENYNISILSGKITELRSDAYFGNLYFRRDNELLNLDTKPSDIIALAVRMKFSLYVKDDIIKQLGTNIC